jgi:hypothetical protein
MQIWPDASEAPVENEAPGISASSPHERLSVTGRGASLLVVFFLNTSLRVKSEQVVHSV